MMPSNIKYRVQFQKSMSIRDFNERYGTEDQCHTESEVEFWLGDDDELDLDGISQFGVVPDVVITLKRFEEAPDVEAD